jgi:tetratricopeptide (TPR) repeat protein
LTLPLRHGRQVYDACFSPDDRRVVTGSVNGTAQVWEIPTDDRPVEDLVLQAQLLAARRVDTTGNHTPLPARDLLAGWQTLKAKYPDSFATRPTEVLAWHQQQAEDCSAVGDWRPLTWHLNRLLETAPERATLRSQRGGAMARLGRWPEAAADFTRAIELGAEGTDVWFQLALVQLSMKDDEGYQRTRKRVLQIYRATTDRDVARAVARVFLHAYGPHSEAEQVVRLLENTGAEPAGYDRYQYLRTLGAILLRAGQHGPSVQRLEEALKAHREAEARSRGQSTPAARSDGANALPGGGTPNDWLFLAMGNHCLGRLDEAKRWLDKATTSLDRGTNEKSIRAWPERQELWLLRREAEDLLKRGR